MYILITHICQINKYVYIFLLANASFLRAFEKCCPKSKRPLANRDETRGEMWPHIVAHYSADLNKSASLSFAPFVPASREF